MGHFFRVRKFRDESNESMIKSLKNGLLFYFILFYFLIWMVICWTKCFFFFLSLQLYIHNLSENFLKSLLLQQKNSSNPNTYNKMFVTYDYLLCVRVYVCVLAWVSVYELLNVYFSFMNEWVNNFFESFLLISWTFELHLCLENSSNGSSGHSFL